MLSFLGSRALHRVVRWTLDAAAAGLIGAAAIALVKRAWAWWLEFVFHVEHPPGSA